MSKYPDTPAYRQMVEEAEKKGHEIEYCFRAGDFEKCRIPLWNWEKCYYRIKPQQDCNQTFVGDLLSEAHEVMRKLVARLENNDDG